MTRTEKQQEKSPLPAGRDAEDSAGPLQQIINPKNLALLKRGDRFVNMAAGLIVMASLGAITAIDDSPRLQTGLAILSIIAISYQVVLGNSVAGKQFLVEPRQLDAAPADAQAAHVGPDARRSDIAGLGGNLVEITQLAIFFRLCFIGVGLAAPLSWG